MSTVIIGGGIIGVSIAYYLSDPELSPEPREIHIVDTSPELFASASGYSAGFLAKDWFASEVEALGELSFELHRDLAKKHNGRELWGYMESTALSLQVGALAGKKAARGDDWLRRGASRAETAARAEEELDEEDIAPLWLTKQAGGIVEKISDSGSVAQVDPLRLCQFLLSKCRERGVLVHYPARAVSLRRDEAAGMTEVALERMDTKTTSWIPCTELVFAAGVWTPRAFNSLFPQPSSVIPVVSLPGYSLLVRSPRHTLEHERDRYRGKAHAIFTTHPRSCGFSPEIFSRGGAEIYIAGLNTPDLPVPAVATDARAMMKPEKCQALRDAAVVLMGKLESESTGEREIKNVDDLDILQEGLCFRPWTKAGIPIVSKISEGILGDKAAIPSGGVFAAVAHGPWGISLSLGTGKVVAEMVAGKTPSADVSGLGL